MYAKYASQSSDGHWRKLKSHQVGKGPSGEDTYGRTWVNRKKKYGLVVLHVQWKIHFTCSKHILKVTPTGLQHGPTTIRPGWESNPVVGPVLPGLAPFGLAIENMPFAYNSSS